MSWKQLGNVLARGLATAAVWVAEHPQVVADVAQAAITKNPAALLNVPKDAAK